MANGMNIIWACLAATFSFGLLCDAASALPSVPSVFKCGAGFQNESFKYLQNVLLLHNQQVSDAVDTQSELMSTGAFAKVDYFSVATANISASYLRNYHAVLILISGFSGVQQGADLGNLLADYWNAGGIVVMTYSAFADTSLQGAFGSLENGYKLMTTTAASEVGTADSLGAVAEPTSPIMAGVTALSVTSAWRSDVRTVSSGSVVVASWGGGQPLAIRGKKNNRNLVTLNLYVPTGTETWSGDGPTLVRNALLFSACMPGKPPPVSRKGLTSCTA
jgi:hypothetical protein